MAIGQCFESTGQPNQQILQASSLRIHIAGMTLHSGQMSKNTTFSSVPFVFLLFVYVQLNVQKSIYPLNDIDV